VRGEIKFPYVYRRVKSKKGRASERVSARSIKTILLLVTFAVMRKAKSGGRVFRLWVCAERARGETFCSSALTRAREAIINSPFCFKQRCDAFGWSVGFISVATEKELHFVGERDRANCCVCWVGLGLCVCVMLCSFTFYVHMYDHTYLHTGIKEWTWCRAVINVLPSPQLFFSPLCHSHEHSLPAIKDTHTHVRSPA
jgi:hypothetical protein